MPRKYIWVSWVLKVYYLTPRYSEKEYNVCIVGNFYKDIGLFKHDLIIYVNRKTLSSRLKEICKWRIYKLCLFLGKFLTEWRKGKLMNSFFFSIFFSFFNVQIALFTLIIFLGEILPIQPRGFQNVIHFHFLAKWKQLSWRQLPRIQFVVL